MDITRLTDNEVKAAMLVHKKGKLDKEKANELYTVAKKNNLFSTREGLKYLKRLDDFANDRDLGEDANACVFCDWPVEEEGEFLCKECLEILEKRYDEISKNDSSKQDSSKQYDSKQDGIKRDSVRQNKEVQEEVRTQKESPKVENENENNQESGKIQIIPGKSRDIKESDVHTEDNKYEADSEAVAVSKKDKEKKDKLKKDKKGKVKKDNKKEIKAKPDNKKEEVNEAKTVERSVKEQNKKRKTSLKIITGILFAIAITGLAIFVFLYITGLRASGNMSAYADSFAEKYASKITQSDWTLGDAVGEVNRQPGLTYEIQMGSKIMSNSSLIVYMDNIDHITTASIRVQNPGINFDSEQLLMMTYLADTLYDDLTLEQAGNIFAQMLDNDGMIKYNGYIWILRVNESNNTFIITDEKVVSDLAGVMTGDPNASANRIEQEEAEEKAATEAKPEEKKETEEKAKEDIEKEIVLMDLVNFIGKPIDELTTNYGEAESLEDNSMRYFEEASVSCIYDEESNMVTYLDVDDKGVKDVTLCGLYIGMKEDDLRAHMIKQGIKDEPEIDDEGKLIYRFNFGENKLRLNVTISDGEATLLAVGIQE